MDKQQTAGVLNLLHTMQEACPIICRSAEERDQAQFQQMYTDMLEGTKHILRIAEENESSGYKILRLACKSVEASLNQIRAYFEQNVKMCSGKIEFELLALPQEAYQNFYFFQYVKENPALLPDYYEKDLKLLGSNAYIDESIERGSFKYEVSIIVLAYNKLEYTKTCVKSLLANIPEGLNYELILVNHGSDDGTKEFFESVPPHKQLDIAVNGGGLNAMSRVAEGEFWLQISNDVVVTPYTIENLLACIRSDSKIAWVVPSTPNISNFQTISAQYDNLDELQRFARENNQSDPFRWEQRVRLCNPIHMIRSSLMASSGLCPGGYYHTFDERHYNSFPDDRLSLLLRRGGYKMMLAKDAYCHHFGSVTLKDEIARQGGQQYYKEGQRLFYKAFGVDPWGTGSCFDAVFLDRVVGEDYGHVEILGVNCGLGGNSLKIKEQLKEYCHNMDACLSSITDDPSFLEDLKGISDTAAIVATMKELKSYMKNRAYQYMIWETPFLIKQKFKTVLNCCLDALAPEGSLIIKLTSQSRELISQKFPRRKELGNDWVVCKRGHP